MPERPIRRQAIEGRPVLSAGHLDWQANFFGGLSDIAIGMYSVIKERERVEQFETARRDLQSAYNLYKQELDNTPLQADTGKEEEEPVPKFRKDMGKAYEQISKRITNGAAAREFDSWAADQKVRWSHESITRATDTYGTIRKATTDKIHNDILLTEFVGQDPTELKEAMDKMEGNITTLRGEGVLTPDEDTQYQFLLQKDLKKLHYNWWRNKLLPLSGKDYAKEIEQSGLDPTEKRRIHWELISNKAVNEIEENVRQERQKTEIRTQMETGKLNFDDIEKIGTDLSDITKDSLRKELSDRSKRTPEKTDHSEYAKIEKDVLDAQTGMKPLGVVEESLLKARFTDRILRDEDYQELKGRLRKPIPPEIADSIKEAVNYGLNATRISRWWPLTQPWAPFTEISDEQKQKAYTRALFAWLDRHRKEENGIITYDVSPTDIYTKSRELVVFARSGGEEPVVPKVGWYEEHPEAIERGMLAYHQVGLEPPDWLINLLPTVTNQEEYDKLPSGRLFKDSEGIIRKKP